MFVSTITYYLFYRFPVLFINLFSIKFFLSQYP